MRVVALSLLLCLLGCDVADYLAGAFPTSSTTLLSASAGCAVAALDFVPYRSTHSSAVEPHFGCPMSRFWDMGLQDFH